MNKTTKSLNGRRSDKIQHDSKACGYIQGLVVATTKLSRADKYKINEAKYRNTGLRQILMKLGCSKLGLTVTSH